MEELKSFFHSKGLEAKDIPKGIIAHEILGLGILITGWAGCYFIRPTATLLNIAKNNPWLKFKSGGSTNTWLVAQERARTSKLVNLVKNSKYLSNQRAHYVSISFAESYLLRKLLIPILVPLKFWLAYEIVVISKKT